MSADYGDRMNKGVDKKQPKDGREREGSIANLQLNFLGTEKIQQHTS